MIIAQETLAEIALEPAGIVVANDGARSSFTVACGDVLLAVSSDLQVLGRWPVGPVGRGCHATCPSRGLALISGPDEVRLLDRTGRVRWRFPHVPWSGAFESGCVWFGSAGLANAVVPARSYGGCRVLRLDWESGDLLAEAAIAAQPAGIVPVHHPGGWVGLSEGEGQDAVRAWWVRPASTPPEPGRIEVVDAGWDDWVLADVDGLGTKIITAPHHTGPLVVRSFPSLEILASVAPPSADTWWDFTACFAKDMIIGRLIGPGERTVAVSQDGAIHDLDTEQGAWLTSAADGTWLSASRSGIRRCRIQPSPE